ncbi:hypothetical protein [Rubripirellula amarantea]|uniref:hypothetical protein n=1 Tax=Rubripirellula amarantea TaxID=2527999 RepID=UPI001A94E87B|nr:hypothetical protein [Rubripirellula amarantea]
MAEFTMVAGTTSIPNRTSRATQAIQRRDSDTSTTTRHIWIITPHRYNVTETISTTNRATTTFTKPATGTEFVV